MPRIQEILNELAAKADAKRKPADTKSARNAFYNSRVWRKTRYRALKESNGRCQCCGASSADGIDLL